MVSALSEDTSAGVLPFEGPEERRLPAGNLESSSPAMIDVVSKSSDFQGPTYNTQASEERADENDAEILNCDRWLISVSSAVPEGKMISAQKDAGDGVNSKGHFVIYVSEPNRERTLVRTAEDFYRLHSDLTESRALVQDLPFGVGRHRDSINMNQGVASKQSQLATPSHKPKKRGSSFFAKVRSVFRDLDQVKPPPVQSKDLERVHVPTTDPPISPPHSPTARSHVEIGLFEFEKGKPLKPDHTHVVGERTTGYPSLTPSSSSVDNAKNDRTKQLGNSATEPIAHRIRSSSSSTLGESAHSSPKTSDQRKSEPSSDDILQPSLLSTSPLDALNFRSLKLSSSSSDSDREGVHIALTNYLSDLCKDGTLSSSLALRNFFITRPSDLEHQSNKQRNLACRQTGIIASGNELDEDSPPTGFDVKISMIENSLPRRIRNAENGISGIDLPENAETSTESHIRSGVNRQVSADAHVSDYGFVRGIITRASSCGQRHGSINELGFSTLPSVVSNGFANQLPTQIDTTEISATSTQKDGANGCIDVPPKPTARRPLTVDDFDLIHTLGKGCAGKVVLVRHKHNQKVYAMKAMVKKHVIAHSELQHTLIEQAVLKRMSTEDEQLRNPFIVKLWWSFHDEYNLYLVLDFHPGGDLATQLSRWGRLGRDRARFYTAEIVEGVEGLHAAGVIYRDLKPENVLLGQDGHIVLVDFGLAADFFPNHRSPGTMLPHWMATGAEQAAEDGRPMMHRHATGVARAKERDLARSFVGTAEYLAPEVIRGLPYSYEVDWWSLGTMLYEALIGNTPFWAENHAEMYVSILNNELIFPEDNALDRDTRSFIRGLLCKDPSMRLTEPRIKRHPYLSMVDFDHVRSRRYIPPYIPPTDSSLEFDTSNFDKTFLVMDTNLKRESVNTAENADHPDKRGTPAVDETAFTAYNFGESEMSRAISKESDTEKSETSSGTGENVVRSDKCQRKSDDESDLASGSDSASVSVSDFGSEDGLGVAATEEALAEVDDNDSTIGNIENGKQETSSGRASEEMSPAVLERIKTLASEPGVKASARHSRDLSRVSVDLDHRHHLEAGDRRSADEWTILEAEPDEQATNGRKVSDTLFAKAVVDKYRLALRKRRGTSKLSRQPSWRSPSSSLVLGRAGNGNNVRDTEKTTGRFMTPLSPTLAGIKSKFKNRSRSKQRFRAEPTSPKAGVLLGRNLHLVSNESTTRETGGTRSAPYPTFLGPLSRGGSDGVVETPVPLSPADDALRVELEQTSKTDMSNKADATHLKAATKCG